MQNVTNIDLLQQMKSNGALFILFGGSHCSVCKSLLPQLSTMLDEKFPEMQSVYIDCEEASKICAQHSVFSLPVVMAYIDGMKIIEIAWVFSIKQLVRDIERPYDLWNDANNN